MSHSCPRNPRREPRKHTLLNSPVNSHQESRNCFNTSCRSLTVWAFKILPLRDANGSRKLRMRHILIQCLIFQLAHLHRTLSWFPNLKFLLCLRPGMLFFEKHCLFKNYAGIMIFFFFLSCHFDFPIALWFFTTIASQASGSHLFYEFGG